MDGPASTAEDSSSAMCTFEEKDILANAISDMVK